MALESNTIIIAGSGRSGTTWLGNIIAGDDCRILFEPFDERRVPELSGLGLRPYFRPEEPCPLWREPIAKILAGGIANDWTDQDRKRLDPARDSGRTVVKEIRANGILAWLDRNVSCRIVYLLRHPCAVIASRIKLRWDTHIDAFLAQPRLMEDYLSPCEEIMRGAETDVQKHAVMWCAENLVPLRQMKDFSWVFCTYERLFTEPEKETARVLGLLGLEFTDSRRMAVNEYSRTCSARTPEAAVNFLSDWKDTLSASDRNDVAAILRAFGIDLYDVDEVMPLK